MAGRSGIGVLVTGFSRVGALKKHAPLVFNSQNIQCGSTVFCLIFLLYVKAYLDINSMKLVTNGIGHVVTADKYTPR